MNVKAIQTVSEQTMKLPIEELVLNMDLFPRMKVSWLTAYQYSQAMLSGSRFPPIRVGLFRKKYYVIDGWHRVEAHRLLKKDSIEVEIKPYTQFRDMFLDAVKLNITHGRQLSVQERVRVITRLEELKFSREEITDIIKVPADRIERLKARAILQGGHYIFLKSLTAKAAELTGGDASSIDQDSINVRDVAGLLNQIIALINSDIFPLENESVKEKTVELYRMLGQRLKLD